MIGMFLAVCMAGNLHNCTTVTRHYATPDACTAAIPSEVALRRQLGFKVILSVCTDDELP